MKLKTRPEDFQVTELTDFPIGTGEYSFYSLRKVSIGTPEAVQAILRNWNLGRGQLSYGGLKDRHAETLQYLTILHGPKKDLEERSYRLHYLGQAKRPFAANDIQGNRFQITLRGISQEKRPRVEENLDRLSKRGIVNYFDDQRFGSLGFSNEWIGRYWCLGDYERTLYLALADPNSHDQPREKEQKNILREKWGDWISCKAALDRSHRRSIVTYLCDHPTDFKRAVALIRSDLRGIYLAAFQSYLWNRWLSDILKEWIGPSNGEEFPSRCGALWAPIRLASSDQEKLQEFSLPLPSARQKEWPQPSVVLLEKVLAQMDLTIPQLRLKYPRDTFFSKGNRQAWIGIPNLEYRFTEEHPRNRICLELHFQLPRGSYATMVIKHLSQVVDIAPMRENDGSKLD